jgi:hypothetical protein
MAKCGFSQLAPPSRFRLTFFLTLVVCTTVLAGLSACVVVTLPPETPTLAAGTPSTATRPPQEPTRTERLVPSPSPTQSLGSAADLLREPTSTRTSSASGPGVPVGAATTYLNVRGGPGTEYPILGWLEPGQSAEITGLSPDGGWWQIRFAGVADESAWVSTAYITARNTRNVPVVKPPSVPLMPVTVTNWRGEYFANPDLAGNPDLVRDDLRINFEWGAGAPATGLPVDDFSVRWTRSLNLSADTYRFYAYVDDGVRLWIDGELVIDQWHDSSPTTYTADVVLAEGVHDLLMEYYDRTGDAVAQLAWEELKGYPDWKGEYFANPSLNGAPVLVRNDVAIDFDWSESPGPGVPADNFSARWTRSLYFPAYVYRFDILVDDGARLWVDDQLIIDGWRSGAPDDFSAEIGLSEGPHTLRLEYFEFRYGAQIYLNWTPVQDGPSWEAEYFDNHRLDGDPVLERDDGLINFMWGTGSPGPDVPADNFSVRWRQDVDFEGGDYIFNVCMDDGARLWVDGDLLIDSWQEGRVRFLQAGYHLRSGTHHVKVEYFERTGNAQIEVSWDRQ